ncbi:MAG: M20/M25/M40 family metallo-hydrolase, partial [Anaeroplasmataceae bacterium]
RNIVPDFTKVKLSINLDKEFKKFLSDNHYSGKIKNGYYTVDGKSCHAMMPQNGLNSNFIMIDFLNKYAPSSFTNFMDKYFNFCIDGTKLGVYVYDNDMKALTINPGVFEFKDNSINIKLDMRVPVDNYQSTIENKFDEIKKEFSGFDYKLAVAVPLHFVDPKSHLVKSLMNAYQEITNDYKTLPFTIGGGTYSKFIPNCCGFGPRFIDSPDTIHKPDEYMSLEDIKKNIAIYTKAIYELACK